MVPRQHLASISWDKKQYIPSTVAYDNFNVEIFKLDTHIHGTNHKISLNYFGEYPPLCHALLPIRMFCNMHGEIM
jgi:hypothetical protein